MFFKQNNKIKQLILVVLTLVAVILTFMFKPIPQSLAYHNFADKRFFWELPNGWNVLTNIPFLITGLFGLFLVRKSTVDKPFKLIYNCLFAGIFLTGIGSGYYHFRPGNSTLVFDRIPMTISFMSLLSATISESIDRKIGSRLLFPFIITGVGSVFIWYFTELNGKGDLRLYILVQFYPMLLIPLILILFPCKQNKSVQVVLFMALIWYIIAKFLEHFDQQIYSTGILISGHSLKHLAAGIATWYLVLLFEKKHINQASLPFQ